MSRWRNRKICNRKNRIFDSDLDSDVIHTRVTTKNTHTFKKKSPGHLKSIDGSVLTKDLQS